MSNNTEIKEVKETKVEEAVEETTEKKETVTAKIAGFAKKHGKKILAGAGIALLAVGAYALGKRSAEAEFNDTYEIVDDTSSDEAGCSDDTE